VENDRELLELAAKAAGHTLYPEWDCAESGIFIGCGVDGDLQRVWNPLADDGDALRLAVKLGIVIDTTDGVHVMYRISGCAHPITEYEFDDIQAATRRAIVRAAAEIGKQMP